MKTRILTAIILIPLLVLILLSPSAVIAGAVIVISVVGLYEFYKATGLNDKKCLCALGYLAAVIVPLMRGYVNFVLYAPLVYLFMLLLFVIMLAQHKTVSVTDAAMMIFGVIYIPYFLTNLLYIRELEYGKILIWIPFVGAFLTDTCAYFAGVFLGRHKLCPEISPKKTIEGSVGGILGCMVACMLYGLLMENVWSLNVNYISLAALGFPMSIVSQIGDLSASIIKRKFGIKDYGNLFPGHGGILGRLDSVIMIAPMVYLYIVNIGFLK
jgi:phosphatidate cytidylyltransferase